MFKQHKTFDLAKERQPKKRDTFYQPKKCKYLKFILPPVLIAFFLLLILLNVDFDNEIYQIPQTNALLLAEEELSVGDQNLEIVIGDGHNGTIKNEKEIIQNIDAKEYEINESTSPIWSGRLNIVSKLAGAMKCVSNIENCSLVCNDGSVSYVDESLEQLQSKCPNIDLALEMNRCEFYNGILKKTFFGGYFCLMYLAINECNLQTIQDATFTHANVKNLKTLKLTNNQLLMLQASTLAGLTNIRYFEFKQFPLEKEFDGKDFIKSMITALTLIVQPSINSTTISDPLKWWPGLTLEVATYLDLSNTNLQNVLTVQSFVPFKALTTLILFNCNLHSLGSNTFGPVAYTLISLDLRFNHLKTLDINFFYLMETQNVQLQLELNEWHCECDFELLEYFEMYNANMMEEIICDSPQEYYELDLKQLYVICQSIGTTALTTTVSSSSSTTTPHITIPTTTTSVSTTVTTLDPTSINPTTITTWETSPTTTTSEISTTTTTTLKPAPTISPTPEHTTTTSTTPTPEHATTTTATPSPEHTTTTSQPIFTEKVAITCYKDIHKTDAFKTDIVKETLNFTVYTTSTTSVRIEIPINEQWEAFTLLYFTNYNDSQSINGYNTSSEALTLKGHITITNLQSSKVYLFCVIKDSSTDISPYDCQAHFLANMEPKVWLLQQDKAWFLTTSILSSLIVFVCSVFAVYCLLRRHPYWLLRRNERILQVHNRPNEVLVVSRKSTKEALSLNASPVSQRSSNYLKPLQPSRVNALITAETSLYSSTLTVPLTKAPSSPPTCSRLKSSDMKLDLSRTQLSTTGCHMRKSKPNTLSVISEPIYQTIDHYEAVNF